MDVYALMAGAVTISVLHAILPNHWLPFVLVGNAQNWEDRKILRIAFFAGGGHVLMTVLLGVAVALAGSLIASSLDVLLLPVTSGILIAFGVVYIILGLRKKQHHTEVPDKATALSLFIMLTFSPCEAMIPVFFAASPYGGAVLAVLVVIVALTTIGGMLLLIYLTMIGYKRIHSHWLEENERIVIGTLLLILGVFVLLSHGFA
ncbi:MAG: hypothetical protein LN415_04825 [Candidatus Thermoplasmatota archaeon]|nr:hypothetical protein [Candidatus Thermoplasmatota archaeon]